MSTNDLPVGLSQPAQRTLARAGIKQLSDFSKFRESEIKELHGIGPNALQLITKTLAKKGFSFAAVSM